MKYSIIFGLLILGGCTSVDVRPISASARLDRICIEFNSEVNVEVLCRSCRRTSSVTASARSSITPRDPGIANSQ